jgi:hypothetical protein
MFLINNYMSVPVDHNKECWSAFCLDDQIAEKELRKMVSKLAEKKLIVSAKKELIGDTKHTLNGMLPYKFTIITAPRVEPN